MQKIPDGGGVQCGGNGERLFIRGKEITVERRGGGITGGNADLDKAAGGGICKIAEILRSHSGLGDEADMIRRCWNILWQRIIWMMQQNIWSI